MQTPSSPLVLAMLNSIGAASVQFGRDVYNDSTLALRALLKNGSGILIILLLTVAVAANVTLYSLVFAVTMRPLPLGEPDRLVLIWNQHKNSSTRERGIATPAEVARWRADSKSFSEIATAELWTENRSAAIDLITGDSSSRLPGAFVSPTFFDVIDVRARVGRTFKSDDTDSPVVVISHQLWQERFGSGLDVVGREILLAAGRQRTPRTFTIVGVLPTGFQFTYPEGTQIWLLQSHKVPQDALLYWTVARLRPGVSLEQAQTEMSAIAAQVALENPTKTFLANLTVYVEPIADYVLGNVRPLLLMLWVVVIASAAIAVANMCCILAAASAARRTELDTRYALGASPWRLVRQLVTETWMLALVGAILGSVLAVWTQDIVRNLLPAQVPRAREMHVGAGVISMSLVTAGSVGILAGLFLGVGLLRRYRRDYRVGLRGSLENPVGLATSVIVCQSLLVAVALTVAGGALVSLFRLERTDVGFAAPGLVVSKVELLAEKYRDPNRAAQFYDLVLDALRSRHGVDGAVVASAFPFAGTNLVTPIPLPDRPTSTIAASRCRVDASYFSLIGVQFLAGRTFDAAEGRGTSRAAIVSRSLALALYETPDVLGKKLRLDSTVELEIVGVVADVRDRRLDEPSLPTYYVPRGVGPNRTGFVVIRVRNEDGNWGEVIRSAVKSIDPAQPVDRIATAQELIGTSVRDRAFASATITMVAGLAWLMASAGFFGLVSWDVRQRRVQTAVRLALGASSGQIIRDVMFRTLYPVCAGVLMALPLTLLFTNIDFESAELRLVASTGPGFLLASGVVLISSAMAAYIGAMTATRMQPVKFMGSHQQEY